jgi:glutathione S-transferase
MAKITLWGFNGSTYVRTVRMLLAEKGVRDYEQVPVDVLNGEPKEAEHLSRHPFGKVPVVDVDGFRIIETAAIARYLDAVLPGPSFVPADPKNVARMDMVVNIIDSYGYGPMIGGVVAYHFFPDFVGGKNEAVHREGLEKSRKVLSELMRIKGSSAFLAGDDASIAAPRRSARGRWMPRSERRQAKGPNGGSRGSWDCSRSEEAIAPRGASG